MLLLALPVMESGRRLARGRDDVDGGHDDRHPVTEMGRLIESLIIVLGVGVLGTATGFLAGASISPTVADQPGDAAPRSSGTPDRADDERGES